MPYGANGAIATAVRAMPPALDYGPVVRGGARRGSRSDDRA